MADLLHPERWQAFDANGDPVPGAKAYFYDTGTTTLRTVYSDEALTTPHPSPLVADSAGVFAAVYATGTTNVKAVVTKADDSALYTVDPVIKMATALSAAGSVEFAPTATVLATDVQAAIEEVDGNITPAPLSKAAGYTVVLADRNALINCTASLTLALTAAATLGAGFRVRVRADAGATVTIDPNAAETVNGAATLTLHGGGALELTCTGTAWLAEYLPTELTGIAALGSSGLIARTGSGTASARTITAGTGITVTNGDGVSGNPTVALSTGSSGPTALSGTAIDFTSIPSTVTWIELLLDNASLSGVDNFLIQGLVGGTPITTGYAASSFLSSGGVFSASGFIIRMASAASLLSGILRLVLVPGSTKWCSSHSMGAPATVSAAGGGAVDLGGTLDGVRITRTGTDTFDAGNVSVRWG